MRKYLISMNLIAFAFFSASALAQPAKVTEPTTQDNSVESFFQLRSTTGAASKSSKDAEKKQEKKSRVGSFLFKVFDNLGVPLPMSKLEELDPSLKSNDTSKKAELPRRGPSSNLERIQPPDQGSSENASKVVPKIPQSELEGTMYDSAATPDEKNSAK